MSRIADTFQALKQAGRTAIMPYLMTGFPERESVLELMPALEAAGADLFELGVPFSDPLADGATIQRAGEQALRNGVRVSYCLETVAAVRAKGVKAPIVMMGYYNPFLQYGIERLVREASEVGVDGLIVPDLPPEEGLELQAICQKYGLDLIRFITPTTTEERMVEVGQIASGFIYCVSVNGVTGARTELWEGLPNFLQTVRSHTSVPLVVGFGISTAAHVQQVGQNADGAIVASALVNVLDRAAPEQRVEAAVEYIRSLRA